MISIIITLITHCLRMLLQYYNHSFGTRGRGIAFATKYTICGHDLQTPNALLVREIQHVPQCELRPPWPATVNCKFWSNLKKLPDDLQLHAAAIEFFNAAGIAIVRK